MSRTHSNTSLELSSETERVLHHCSVDWTLIWNREPPCLRSYGGCVAAAWPGPGPRAWMWGSGLRHQLRGVQTVLKHNLFHPSYPSRSILFAFGCERVQVCRSWIRLESRGAVGSQILLSLLTLFRWTLDIRRSRKGESCWILSRVACRPSSGTRQLFGGADSEGSASPLRGLCCAIELHSCRASQALIPPRPARQSQDSGGTNSSFLTACFSLICCILQGDW